MYNLIKTAKINHKGNLIIKVIAAGEIKDAPDGSWKNQKVTIRDNSGDIDFMLWNVAVGSLDTAERLVDEEIKRLSLTVPPMPKQRNGGKRLKINMAGIGDEIILGQNQTDPDNLSPNQYSIYDTLSKPRTYKELYFLYDGVIPNSSVRRILYSLKEKGLAEKTKNSNEWNAIPFVDDNVSLQKEIRALRQKYIDKKQLVTERLEK